MSRVNHFKVGLFVVFFTALGVAGLLWVGAGHLFQNTKRYASFFSESVGGLATGANVNYLGVKVGRVASVNLVPGKRLVRVLMDLHPDFEVDDSMAVELSLQGITGQFNLGIVKAPSNISELTPVINFPVKYPVIPSRPGQLTRLENALDEAYKKFNSIDLNNLVTGWTEAGKNLDAVVKGDELRETLENIGKISEEVKDLTANLGRRGNSQELEATLKDLSQTARAARKASEALSSQLSALPPNSLRRLTTKADRMMETGQTSVSSADKEVEKTLEAFQQTLNQLNQMLAEFRGLAQSLRQQPSRIFTRPSGGEPFGR